jgi:hypothetical protein
MLGLTKKQLDAVYVNRASLGRLLAFFTIETFAETFAKCQVAVTRHIWVEGLLGKGNGDLRVIAYSEAYMHKAEMSAMITPVLRSESGTHACKVGPCHGRKGRKGHTARGTEDASLCSF